MLRPGAVLSNPDCTVQALRFLSPGGLPRAVRRRVKLGGSLQPAKPALAVRRNRPCKWRQLDTTKKYRIWAQGATDQVGHRNYLAQLLPHMKACTDPDFDLEFKTMTPSVTTVHALSEFRFSRAVVRGAIGRPAARRLFRRTTFRTSA